MKRKFFSWLVLCFVVFAFGTGGCGGSDNDNIASSVDWETMAGTWTPTSGSLRFYSSSGGTPVTFNLETSRTDNVEVAIKASGNSYYNFEFGEGEITFRGNTSYQGSRTHVYTYEDLPTSYKASGKTLSNEISTDGGWLTTTIRQVSSSVVDVTITIKNTSDNLTIEEAQVRLQRSGSYTEDEDADNEEE